MAPLTRTAPPDVFTLQLLLIERETPRRCQTFFQGMLRERVNLVEQREFANSFGLVDSSNEQVRNLSRNIDTISEWILKFMGK